LPLKTPLSIKALILFPAIQITFHFLRATQYPQEAKETQRTDPIKHLFTTTKPGEGEKIPRWQEPDIPNNII